MGENRIENDWAKKLKKCRKERDDVFLTCDAMRTILRMNKATLEQKRKAQALLEDYRRADNGI